MAQTLDPPTFQPPPTERAYPATPALGEPVWPLAEMLFPRQGDWTEAEFLKLDLMRVELVDGRLEFLPVGNELHQGIVLFLVTALTALLRPGDRGKVMFAPFKVKTVGGHFREPDIVVMLAENYSKRSPGHWRGADLAIEIISPDDPERDYVDKRAEYAKAGIREYWIVDPIRRRVVLLMLRDGEYQEISTYLPGDVATSQVVAGFEVDVTKTLAAGE